jgi:hypothetical protein
VQWQTESPLVKSHKGHHLSVGESRECGIFLHAIGRELCRHHEPLFREILQVLLHNFGRGPILFGHGLRRKEKQHSLNLGIPLSFSSLFFILSIYPSFFLGVGKDVRERQIVPEGVGMHKGGRLLFITPRCHN